MSLPKELYKRARRVGGRLKDVYRFQIRARLNMRRDPATGMLYQDAYNHRVFLRSHKDYLHPALLDWLCRDIYFKFYKPAAGDVIVDVGAGYGHEAFYLLQAEPHIRYFGLEVQPSIYEALSNTFDPVSDKCKAVGLAISHEPQLLIGSVNNYSKASTVGSGCVAVQTITWDGFLSKYGLNEIDLLKVNIEGGERMLLPEIADYSKIKSISISAHDFRADRGEGEFFRTREFVCDFLSEKGYRIQSVDDESAWLRNWIFADRPDV